MIGDRWKLTREMLGMPVGSIGYVINEYQDYDFHDGIGIQLIFQNGNYDGFSVNDQDNFLEFLGHNERIENYQFKNVLQVEKDYRNHYWLWE